MVLEDPPFRGRCAASIRQASGRPYVLKTTDLSNVQSTDCILLDRKFVHLSALRLSNVSLQRKIGTKKKIMKFEFITALLMETEVFWNITRCSLVYSYGRFKEAYCLHSQCPLSSRTVGLCLLGSRIWNSSSSRRAVTTQNLIGLRAP